MRMRNLMTMLCVATALAGQPFDAVWAQNAKIDQRSINFHNDARKAMEKGDFRTAQIQLRNAVRQDPGNLDARFDLGIVNLRLGDVAGAEKDLQQAMEGGFDPERSIPDYAGVLLIQRKFDKLLADIRPGNHSPRLNARIHALRGTAHLALNQAADAERELRQSLAIQPTADAHVSLARLAIVQRNAAEAVRQADAAIAVDAGSAEAHLVRGELRRGTGDRDGARQDLNKAVELNPQLITARLARAELSISENKIDDVQTDGEAVLQLSPRHPHGLYLRALVLAQKNEMAKAGEIMQQNQQFTQSYAPAMYLSAVINFNLNRAQQAETELTQVLALRQGHQAARRLLAVLQLRRGDAEKALQTLSPIREASANDAQYLALLGEAYMRLRRFDEATQALEQAAKIDPANRAVLANLGASNLQTGQRDEGVAQLEAALARDPTMVGASNLLVFTLLRERNFVRARQVAEDLRGKLKDSPLPNFYLGLVSLSEGKQNEAEAEFRRAIEISPSFRQATVQLANIKVAQGKFDEARTVFERQLQVSPRDADTMLNLADLEVRRGQPERAQQWLERAIATDERAIAPRFILTELNIARNDLEKALVSGRDLMNIAPQDPRVLDLMGRVHFANKDPQNAAALFRRAAALNPKESMLQLRLAEALVQGNDDAAARIAFEEAIRLQPDLQPAWTGRVRLEAQKVGGPAALQVAEKLRQQYPDAMAGDLMVGDLLFALNRLPEARTAFEAALQKGPSSDAVNRLFAIRLRSGEPPEQALDFVRDWLKRFPQDTQVRFALSSYLIENGRQAEALAETEELHRRDANNPVILNNLAWLLNERKDARAKDFAARAHALAPDAPAVADTYGWILFHGGERTKGLDLLRRAAQNAPREAQIQYHFAFALAETGQKDEAKAILREILGTRRVFAGRDDAVKLLQRLE
jgi:putative PEP-CTERM system TPR-repeat lipoprotein